MGRVKGTLRRQLLAWGLLWTISITIIPFSLWHNHRAQETPCHSGNQALEQSPCHRSVFHASRYQSSLCGHRAHLHQHKPPCPLCEFAHTRVEYGPPQSFSFLPPTPPVPTYGWEQSSIYPDAGLISIFNKGPPVDSRFNS